MAEKGTADQVDSFGKDEAGSHIAEEHLAVVLCTAGERPRDSSLHIETQRDYTFFLVHDCEKYYSRSGVGTGL